MLWAKMRRPRAKRIAIRTNLATNTKNRTQKRGPVGTSFRALFFSDVYADSRNRSRDDDLVCRRRRVVL
jgi:hypothetical protein